MKLMARENVTYYVPTSLFKFSCSLQFIYVKILRFMMKPIYIYIYTFRRFVKPTK